MKLITRKKQKELLFTNVKFVGFKLRQVIIFVFDENVNQNDTVVFTWVHNGIDVTYRAFTNMISIICSMNLNDVIVSFLSIQFFLSINMTISSVNTEPFSIVSIDDVVENSAIFTFIWITCFHTAYKVTRIFFFGYLME